MRSITLRRLCAPRRRRLVLECLEQRYLLSADGVSVWQNPSDPLDVNDDGVDNLLDVLVLEEFRRVNGDIAVLCSAKEGAPPPFVDVNGDCAFNGADSVALKNGIRLRPEGEPPIAAVNFVHAQDRGAFNSDFLMEPQSDTGFPTSPPVGLPFAGIGSVPFDFRVNDAVPGRSWPAEPEEVTPRQELEKVFEQIEDWLEAQGVKWPDGFDKDELGRLGVETVDEALVLLAEEFEHLDFSRLDAELLKPREGAVEAPSPEAAQEPADEAGADAEAKAEEVEDSAENVVAPVLAEGSSHDGSRRAAMAVVAA